MLGILQHAFGCPTCGAYVTHFMESHLNEDTSFIDAVHRQDSEVVSFTIYCDTVSDKECTQEDTAYYRISLDKFEAEVDDLRQHIFELKDELKSAKKALEKAHGPSYSEVVQKSTTKARAPRCPSLLYRRQQSLLCQPNSESLILGKVKARRDIRGGCRHGRSPQIRRGSRLRVACLI